MCFNQYDLSNSGGSLAVLIRRGMLTHLGEDSAELEVELA